MRVEKTLTAKTLASQLSFLFHCGLRSTVLLVNKFNMWFDFLLVSGIIGAMIVSTTLIGSYYALGVLYFYFVCVGVMYSGE
jgi:hypothetical protein